MRKSRGTGRFRMLALRRGWVVVLTLLVAIGGGWAFSRRHPPTYSASAYVLVNSGTTSTSPGPANDANSLATTYAELIPKDRNILTAVGSTLNVQPDAVQHAISVFTTSSTAVLELRYNSANPSEAIRGSQALAQAVSGPIPATPTIPPNAVLLASLPTTATEASSARTLAIPVGGVAGLLLGIILAVAWERFDPRIDDADDLRHTIAIPVTSTEELFPRGASALLRRWKEGVAFDGLKVGLVASELRTNAMVRDVRTLLEAGAELLPLRARGDAPGANGAGERPNRGVVLSVYGTPGSDEVGHVAALETNFVALVVPRGGRVKNVRWALESLEEYGRPPAWALLGGRPRKWRPRSTADRSGPAGERASPGTAPQMASAPDGEPFEPVSVPYDGEALPRPGQADRG